MSPDGLAVVVRAAIEALAAEDAWEAEREALAALDELVALAKQAAAYREALEQIAVARPTSGVPLRDTIEGCAFIARAVLATWQDKP